MAWDTAEVTEELTPTCISTQARYVGGITLVAGAAAAALELFDGNPATDGTLKETLEAAASATSLRNFEQGLLLPKGLYVQVVGDGAVGYVRYK